MVPRYARPAMTAIWEPEARYRIWFEIEAHATEKLGELGVVPPSGAKALWDWWATNPAIDVAAIDAIEAVTKHDVIAFLDWVAQQVGPEALTRAFRAALDMGRISTAFVAECLGRPHAAPRLFPAEGR